MSLFQCEYCGCCENTALASQGYKYNTDWFNWSGIEERKGMLLCSACGPKQIWHGEFDRVFLPKGMFKTNHEGNLEHIETGSIEFKKYEIHDGLKLSLQFYANHGQLKLVENKTGVPVRRIENFLENDVLSAEDRKELQGPIKEEREKTIIRQNMMDDKNYRGYCGGECRLMPRIDKNFVCPNCGWKAKFEPEFFDRYKKKWGIDTDELLIQIDIAEEEARNTNIGIIGGGYGGLLTEALIHVKETHPFITDRSMFPSINRLFRPGKEKTKCLLPLCENRTDHNSGYCSKVCKVENRRLIKGRL